MEYPNGIERTSFFENIKKVENKKDPSLHIDHVGGERLYLDYSGDKAHYTDRETGQIIEVEIFLLLAGVQVAIHILK